MTPKMSAALLAGAVIVLGGGWWLSRSAGTGTSASSGTGLMFPDLGAKLDQAVRVEIQHQATTLVITRAGGVWGLADRGGYKVQPARMHALLEGLTELRLTEPRTSDPAEYAKLGVEDPSTPEATSELLRVLPAQGPPLVALIVGHRRVRTQGDVPETVYLRRPGEAQAWLAEGRLPMDADPQIWIDRDILNIDHTKIASVTVERKGAKLQFEHKGETLALTAPADHPKLDDYKVEDVGRALENLSLTDVKPDGAFTGEKLGEATYTLTDGERVVAQVFRAGPAEKPETWAQFAVSGADGAAKIAADALESRVKGWTYQLGAWKEPALLPNLEVLKASEPAPAVVPVPPALTVPTTPREADQQAAPAAK